jgi:hypothetical protein
VLPNGLHRIRHYGLFAKGSCADNIALARELLAAANSEGQSTAADASKPTCSCCGGRMIIIEVFERGATPRYQPTPPETAIRMDTSRPRRNPANLLIALAASHPATAQRAQIAASHRKSSDNLKLKDSMPPVAH